MAVSFSFIVYSHAIKNLSNTSSWRFAMGRRSCCYREYYIASFLPAGNASLVNIGITTQRLLRVRVCTSTGSPAADVMDLQLSEGYATKFKFKSIYLLANGHGTQGKAMQVAMHHCRRSDAVANNKLLVHISFSWLFMSCPRHSGSI